MKNALRVLFGVVAITSFVACGMPSDPKKDVDRIIEEMEADQKKNQAELDAIIKQAQETGKSVAAELNKGGQPPLVRLQGAFFAQNTLHPQVDVKIMAGFSRTGEPTAIEPSRQQFLISEAVDDTKLKKLVDKATYINFGCDMSKRPEVASMTEVKLQTKPFESTYATAAFFCNTVINEDVNLVVGMAIFEEAQVRVMDSGIFGLNILTSEVILKGSNHIHAKGLYNKSTVAIQIAALKLNGEGTLEIKAEGSDFVAQEADPEKK